MRRWQHRLHCGQDRPRSRGVYTSGSRCSLENHGSSPLARGLHGRPLAPQPVNGIIPARAGFTFQRFVERPSRRDHPRSRGVYKSYTIDPNGTVGSSPLARGLPDPPLEIIRRGDHPRSRGVYERCPAGVVADPGSSPLARGLQVVHDRPERDGRIIPARAGFTSRPISTCPASQDHPRSRGVYRYCSRQYSS